MMTDRMIAGRKTTQQPKHGCKPTGISAGLSLTEEGSMVVGRTSSEMASAGLGIENMSSDMVCVAPRIAIMASAMVGASWDIDTVSVE